MGGDDAPHVPIRAALEALSDEGGEELEVLLVGDPDAIRGELREMGRAPDALPVVEAREQVGMGEAPARAVRRKQDSSIVVGVELQRRGEADAFVSAGSTGAVMAASLLVLGALPGVDRPAVGAVFPTSGAPTLVLDVGANVHADPENLLQFAHLGSIYIRELLEADPPRVGLLNVGREPEKGTELTRAAHRLLREDPQLRFVGNVEGRDIVQGACDVAVCDGFVGNVLLKFYESIAGFVVRLLGDPPGAEHPELEAVRRVLDYAEYGGAPLLGVDGVSIICHGASPPRAVRNAIGVARRSVETRIVAQMSRDLERTEAGPG
jgi:glycerol-3-phosphate acyltransferase PlsX